MRVWRLAPDANAAPDGGLSPPDTCVALVVARVSDVGDRRLFDGAAEVDGLSQMQHSTSITTQLLAYTSVDAPARLHLSGCNTPARLQLLDYTSVNAPAGLLLLDYTSVN